MKRHHSLGVVALTALIMLVLTAGAPGQSNAEVLGNLPPEGAMIAEVSTTTESFSSGELYWSVDVVTLVAEIPEVWLPLPEFSSGGLAELDECMWIIGSLDWDLSFSESHPFSIRSHYSIQGGVLTLIFQIEGNPSIIFGSVSFDITAIAIRTTTPVARESVSFGEIKAMYRN